MSLRFPALSMLPLDRYAGVLSATNMRQITARIDDLRAYLSGRVIWNINSSSAGGGVAEMVRSLLAYARGAGVDARWVVIGGDPEFFRITKRIHNAIHGIRGDDSALDLAARRVFERVGASHAAELAPLIQPQDVIIVHDPQPAGMIPVLLGRGAHVIWRCHIGQDEINAEVERGWQFLAPYLTDVGAYVFSRATYVTASHLDAERALVIPPTLDPFSPKNQWLDGGCVRAILERIGLIRSSDGDSVRTFVREDGSPGRVDRTADVIREGPAPAEAMPLIAQVSRWDRLKDPLGVLEAFARLDAKRSRDCHLVLAGPSTDGVRDDPEGRGALGEVVTRWLALPENVRRRVQIVSLPTLDVDENAAMVNALQRHATVIVQKSLHEGFGLTVAEAMWKGRPVVASAVGGIQDQIEDGVHGLLLRDPTDLDAFAAAIVRLLDDPAEAQRMGERGHARVLQRYLGIDSLLRYGALIERLDGRAGRASAVDLPAPDAR